MRTCPGLLTQIVATQFLAVLDLCLDWLELLGSALCIPSMIVLFVDNLLLSLASSILCVLLCKFLLCPDGCSAELGEFSSLFVLVLQVSLCPRSTGLCPFHPKFPVNPRPQLWLDAWTQALLLFSRRAFICVLQVHGPRVQHLL